MASELTMTSTPLGGLTEQQVLLLEEDLPGDVVKSRKKGGVNLSYIEGHYAIRVANRIFGFAGWRRETKEMRLVVEKPYKDDGSGYLVGYVARVAVYVRTEDGWVESDGWGYGEGIDYGNPGLAHESAVKEAETDAMKRALVKWGDPFGLALYDKTQAHVDKEGGNGNGNGNGRKPQAVPPPAPVGRREERAPASDHGGKFANVGELFTALSKLGIRDSAARGRLQAKLGLPEDLAQAGPEVWAQLYTTAVAEKGGN